MLLREKEWGKKKKAAFPSISSDLKTKEPSQLA